MKKKHEQEYLILLLIILWVLFVLGGYYYYHKPINIKMVLPPLSALLDIVFVMAFAGVAGGLGQRLLRAERIPPLERMVMQFALGSGIIGLVWLAFGVLGLYRFPISAPLLIVGIILLRGDIKVWYRQLSILGVAWKRNRGLEKSLAVFSAVQVIYQLFIALAPPTKWDALAYHLQLPREYLAAGKFIFVPENPYWGHPQLVEMLNTLAMSFHHAETAAVLGWGIGILFLIGLFGFTNTQLERVNPDSHSTTAGWLAVFAVMVGYTFRYLMGWSYTDLYSALYGLCAIITFFAWLDEHEPGWFLWTGLFCGFALGAKWTGGLLPVGLFLAAILFGKRNRLTAKTWLLAGGIVFAAVLPWLAKNMIATGSPIYPYFFGTQWIDAARISASNLPPAKIEWWQNLLVPISTTWAGIDTAPGFSADLGPLLLMFAVPGLWLYRRNEKTQTLVILLTLTGLSIALLGLRFEFLLQTRLYYAMLPALVIPCGWGWEWLQCQVLEEVRLRRVLSAVVLLVCGFSFWQDTYLMANSTPIHYFLGTQTEQSYLENNLGDYIPAMEKLKSLPASSKILMLWEPRGLYAPLNAQADLWIDRWCTDRRELQTTKAILNRWKQEDFSHVIIFKRGIELIRPKPGEASSADWIILQDLLASLPKPSSIGTDYLFYNLE